MGQISCSLHRVVRQIVCLPIFLYQLLVRPVMKPCCRFYPSCSEYASTAIQYHGVLMGLKLAIWRILRCHPWADGGYDPVSLPNLPNKRE